MSDKTSINSQTDKLFDQARWVLANPWLSEGQSDDRTPMNGTVEKSDRNRSSLRAFARRSHQLMFKKWSRARRD